MEKEKIEIKIKIDDQKEIKITALISCISGKDPIVAFVILDFGLLKIKGCRVKWADFNKDGNLSLVFDLPAYRAGANFIKAVFIPDKRIYMQISNAIIEKVKDLLNNKDVNDDNGGGKNEGEININDIPF